MSEDVLSNIRARIEKCRRLADLISSPEARQSLLEMAEQGEADLKKLEKELGGGRS